MIAIKGNEFIYFDVDDTLVSWRNYPQGTERSLPFTDPQTKAIEMLEPIQKTIAALINHKKEGKTIIVWSAGGSEWAEEVVKTLQLEQYVDVCLTKPKEYYDDIPCTEFMGTRHDLTRK